jgi:hypothetical protein
MHSLRICLILNAFEIGYIADLIYHAASRQAEDDMSFSTNGTEK